MHVLFQALVWLMVAPVYADLSSSNSMPPLGKPTFSPGLAMCMAGCEHAGTAKDCFDYCMRLAKNGGAENERQALNAICGKKVGPALADCLAPLASGDRKGRRVREAELHGSEGTAH